MLKSVVIGVGILAALVLATAYLSSTGREKYFANFPNLGREITRAPLLLIPIDDQKEGFSSDSQICEPISFQRFEHAYIRLRGLRTQLVFLSLPLNRLPAKSPEELASIIKSIPTAFVEWTTPGDRGEPPPLPAAIKNAVVAQLRLPAPEADPLQLALRSYAESASVGGGPAIVDLLRKYRDSEITTPDGAALIDPVGSPGKVFETHPFKEFTDPRSILASWIDTGYLAVLGTTNPYVPSGNEGLDYSALEFLGAIIENLVANRWIAHVSRRAEHLLIAPLSALLVMCVLAFPLREAAVLTGVAVIGWLLLSYACFARLFLILPGHIVFCEMLPVVFVLRVIFHWLHKGPAETIPAG